MTLRLALLALPLALAACGDMDDLRMPWDKPEPPAAPVQPAKPGIPPPPEVSPLQQPIELADAARVPVATANAETVNLTTVAAAGEGWSVDVNAGTARFARPGAKTANVAVRRMVYARGIEFVGTLGGAPFVLNVTDTDCGTMPLTANLRANGKRYAGCAQPAAAAAAPADPAKKVAGK